MEKVKIAQGKNAKLWLLDLIKLMEGEFDSFITHIPENRIEIPTHLQEWSPKDEINHLLFWNTVFIFNVKSRQKRQPILNPKNYLAMNDVAWFYGKELTWQEIKESIQKLFKDLYVLFTSLSLEELTDENKFNLGYSKSPKPLIEDFLYEIVDHPLHHMLGMYSKFQDKKNAKKMLIAIKNHLQNSASKWTTKPLKKVSTYLNNF